MATQRERFLQYLQTCVKSTRVTDSNPLLLGGNAPKDYARFLESDRLFDRDTLLVCHYDVNFLFVVSLYALNNKSKKASWKKKVLGNPHWREHGGNLPVEDAAGGTDFIRLHDENV